MVCGVSSICLRLCRGELLVRGFLVKMLRVVVLRCLVCSEVVSVFLLMRGLW